MPSPTPTTRDAASVAPQAIIMAAGKGKRMGSDLPKVLHEACGVPLVTWVVRACRDAGVGRVIVIVGHKGELVRSALASEPQLEFVEQTQQLGTGHATQMAAPLFVDQPACDVFVLAGDAPLIRPGTLSQLLSVHRSTKAAATLATSVLPDATGYGRVVRDPATRGFKAIVEHKDATPEQLAIREINPSYYCFRSDLLFQTLSQVRNQNSQGEYYLTDVPGLLRTQGRTVSLVDAVPPEDVLGVNTPADLAQVESVLRVRLAREPASR